MATKEQTDGAAAVAAAGLGFDLKTPNHVIANLIREDATPTYRERIPEATQANIAATARAIDNDTVAWNEFAGSIMNKVGLTIALVRSYNNRLAKFKRGDLAYGDTVEEIHTNLIKAKHYSSNDFHGERDLFGRIKPDTYTAYHKVNRTDYYGITVDRNALRKAFTTENGLALYIDQLMSIPLSSDQWDEYNLMREALAYLAGKVKQVNVPVIPLDGDARTPARAGVKRIIEQAELLTFPSREYNMAGVDAWADRDELEIFMTPSFKASMDIDALATLFHIDKADVPARITVIDKFPAALGNAQAILTTKDIFLVMDFLIDMTNQPNAVGLHTNFFYHHHELISISPFTPVVVFTTDPVDPDPTPADPPTVSGVTAKVYHAGTDEEATTVDPGAMYKVNAVVALSAQVPGYGAFVTEIVDGAVPRTQITPDGWLMVGPNQADPLTIRVASLTDPTKTTDLVVSVTGAPASEPEGGA